MAHTYASVADFIDYQRDNGSAETITTAMAGRLLLVLEGASRRVDGFCSRSPVFGSGFGPRTATNRYDGDLGVRLRLRDDFTAITSVTARPSTASAAVSLTVDTDYYTEPYDAAPIRSLILHGQGALAAFGWGYRVTTVVGTAGYSNEFLLTSTTVASGLAADATVTTFVTSASPTLSPGQTLLIGSEHLYLTGLSGTTATVLRGQNGTTAAVHANASTISIYRYPRQATDATLGVAMRRWKMRDSGVTPDYGGGQVPGTGAHDTERSILMASIGDLRLVSST